MNDIEKIMELLKKGMIYMPVSVLKSKDVSYKCKELFGVIFTETITEVSYITERTKAIETVTRIMRQKIKNITNSQIREYLLCKDVPKGIKKELVRLFENTDISECFS